MKNDKYTVENFIINIISLSIITGFVYIYLIRLTPKMPKEIFNPICLERGILYLIILLSNIWLLTIIIYSKVNKNDELTTFKLLLKDINETIKNSLYKARAILVLPKYIQSKINTSIRIFMYIFKTQKRCFQMLSYANQSLL